MIYLDADTRDTCCEAIRQGQSIEYLASSLGTDSEQLAKVLHLSTVQPISHEEPDRDVDLWAYDRLAELL